MKSLKPLKGVLNYRSREADESGAGDTSSAPISGAEISDSVLVKSHKPDGVAIKNHSVVYTERSKLIPDSQSRLEYMMPSFNRLDFHLGGQFEMSKSGMVGHNPNYGEKYSPYSKINYKKPKKTGSLYEIESAIERITKDSEPKNEYDPQKKERVAPILKFPERRYNSTIDDFAA